MMYLITTQGKTGSTMLTEMLHNAGIQMWTKACDHNEEESFRQILNQMTWSNNKRIFEVYEPLKVFEYNFLSEDVDNAIRCYDDKDFGFKSPLLIHCYDVIKKYLPVHKIIHIYRDPREMFIRAINGYDVLKAWLYVQEKASDIADVMINYNNIDISKLNMITGRKIENLFDSKKKNRFPYEGNDLDILNECYEQYKKYNGDKDEISFDTRSCANS